MTKRLGLFAFLALICISLVLRPPLAAIGPLLQEIALSLNLNASQQSLLTSIPVFCFGLGAFLSPWLTRRLGLNVTMLIVLTVLLIALVARVLFGFELLLMGTIFVGLGIAITNVLLPTLVRNDSVIRFPTCYRAGGEWLVRWRDARCLAPEVRPRVKILNNRQIPKHYQQARIALR